MVIPHLMGLVSVCITMAGYINQPSKLQRKVEGKEISMIESIHIWFYLVFYTVLYTTLQWYLFQIYAWMKISWHTTFVNKELSFHISTKFICQWLYSNYKFISWTHVNKLTVNCLFWVNIFFKQGVKGLKAFAFYVVTANDECMKPRFKRNLEVEFKDSACAELCLKLGFEKDWYCCNITLSGWFLKRLFRKVPNNHFPS